MNPIAFFTLYQAIWMGAFLAPITTQSATARRALYGK